MSAYKFRVLLDTENNEEIFRDIIIDKADTFETFYNAVIAAFKFEGNQMASFYMSNDNWDKGFEITLLDMSLDDDMIEPVAIMSEQKLVDFIKETEQKVILVHDFVRMWIFLIEFMEIVKDTVDKPKVILSVGMAPPEDSRMMNLDDEFGDFDEESEDEYDNEFGEDFEDEGGDDYGSYEDDY